METINVNDFMDWNTLKFVMVTPEMAQELLSEHYNWNNRKIKPRQIEFLSRMISEKQWIKNPSPVLLSIPVSLDEKKPPKKLLLDGQHRLKAIVKSGIAQELLIIKNVPFEVQGVIDNSLKRQANEVLRIKGTLPKDLTEKRVVTFASAMADPFPSTGYKKRSFNEINEFILKFKDSISWFANRCFNKEENSTDIPTPAKAAIGRAFYYYPNNLDRLGLFIKMLKTNGSVEGFHENSDGAVNQLKTKLNLNRIKQKGSKRRQKDYLETVYAIKCFMDGKIMEKNHQCNTKSSKDEFTLVEKGWVN